MRNIFIDPLVGRLLGIEGQSLAENEEMFTLRIFQAEIAPFSADFTHLRPYFP
jgi:hypothetical protein